MAEAATPLLATKLFIPPARRGLVVRPRLLERFRAALDCSLVLVSAPAGYGKTTFVSEWVRNGRPRVATAWLSLEEEENDPLRFWDYFIAALRTARPAVGEKSLMLLHSSQPVPIESTLTTLINDVASVPRDLILVLDDYHFIHSEAIHTGIAFLLDHLPPKMHLVIGTRVDPPLPLAHLRGKGTLLEIRADDLRFTLEETAALLKELQNVELSAGDLSALNARTEGWAVGLTMAALSIGKQKDIPGFIDAFTGSQRYVMDYLADEVLKRQPDEVRDFLLRTSVLERLSAPLCDSVTGHGASEDMLEKLQAANLFLVSLDQSREWYRYHHLFAELLRHQLEATSGAGEVSLLHQRASEWYEDNGFPDDAVHHALDAQDWERATKLVSAHWEEMVKRAEWRTALGWFHLIPGEVIRAQPRLSLRYATALTRVGQIEAAEAALDHLERMGQDDADLQGEVAFSQGSIAAARSDYPRTIEMAKKALSLLAPDNLTSRARASFLLGVMQYQRGLLKEAERALNDSYEMGRQVRGQEWIGANGATYLAELLFVRGRLGEAQHMAQKAADLAGESPGAAVFARSTQAFILYYRNDLEGAARSARLSVEFSKRGGSVAIWINTCWWLVETRLAQGDLAGATAEMESMDQVARLPGIPRQNRAYHAAWHVLFAIRQRDLASTVEWGNRLQEYADALNFNVSTVPARLLIARGEKEAAAKQLQALHERAVGADAQGLVIGIRIYQALAAPSPDEALIFLTEALTLGRPEGWIRRFADEGRLLSPLLRRALSQGITPEYTAELLRIIEVEELQRTIGKAEPEFSSATASLLTKRETEVLRLLATGLSDRQIAARLVVSLGTVKTHVHRILGKVNATSRTHAVTQARELKLI